MISSPHPAPPEVDWHGIDTVLLDMDGTLLDLHFDNYFWLTHLPKRYAEQRAVDPTQAWEQIRSLIQGHQGTLNWYCLDFWSRTLELDMVELKREVAHLIAWRPETPEFLNWLGTQGKRRVLVTNAHRDSLVLKVAHTGLDAYLDVLFSAHDFDRPKEDRALWEALQQAEPFDPARTLLIDDNESVLASAAQFGIQHLLTIHQPDSRQPGRGPLQFPTINRFSDLH